MIIYCRYGIVCPCYTISIVLIHHPSSGTWLEVSVFGVCLVRIFPHSIFSPNAGKRLTRKTPNTDTFYAVLLFKEGSIILKKYPIKILTLFLQKILGNVIWDSRECSRRFWEMLLKILGKVQCSRRFWRMLLKIWGNVSEDSGEHKFRFILWNIAYFYQILLLNCYKTMEKTFSDQFF